MKIIYLDNAATTSVDPEVFQAMKPYFTKEYGNPSEPHFFGQKAFLAIENARRKVAQALKSKPEEIIFTSGATESINLAHKGLIEGIKDQFNLDKISAKNPHIITSQIEHKAVLETCKHLEEAGLAKVSYLPVDQYGMVRLEDLRKAIKPNTCLVSIMYVNNEVGTIQPIPEIGQFLKQLNKQRAKSHQPYIYFHTDATQAIQYLNCQVDFLGVDLLSLSGHKLHAPKGVGALFVKSGIPLIRQQDGGGQESGMRAGTENVPFIVGLGKAMEINSKVKKQKVKLVTKMRDKLIQGITNIPGIKLTGHPKERAPHIASFTIEGVEGEALVLLLAEKGIIASSGSACTSNILAPSHVLTAMGIPQEIAHGSIRFSLGKETTKDNLNQALSTISKTIQKLRQMAPKI